MNKKIKMMKVMRVHAYGGPEQLRYEEVVIPTLGSKGQILVRVYAASVNPIDTKLASGMKRPVMNNEAIALPWIPGGDFSGIVEDITSDIKNVRKGDAVYGDSPAGGSYAPYVVADADAVALKPKTLNDIESASVPLAAQTAWQALFEHGHLQSGKAVLIHGGSGGVGTFAIQLARWKKAKIMATCREEHKEYLHSLGADIVIDYTQIPFESFAENVDLVIDLVGGETQARSFTVLKPKAYLVSTVSPPSEELATKHHVNALMMTMKPSKAILSQLAELLDTAAIRTNVTKIYPLVEAPKAWADIMSHHTLGKIVLEVSQV
jgi:NADPH:quinone reductase-like Zn-dependent oxidoreductase